MSHKKQSREGKSKNDVRPNRRWILWIVVGVIGIGILLLAMPKQANHNGASPLAPQFTKQGELTLSSKDGKTSITIDIEIADNARKREIGMMGRPVMEEKQGMLFVFEEDEVASFWMKNTILSLDMIFINRDGKIVTIHKNTTPFSEQTYSATGLTLYVLEVNAGFTDKYHVNEGDKMTWKKL